MSVETIKFKSGKSLKVIDGQYVIGAGGACKEKSMVKGKVLNGEYWINNYGDDNLAKGVCEDCNSPCELNGDKAILILDRDTGINLMKSEHCIAFYFKIGDTSKNGHLVSIGTGSSSPNYCKEEGSEWVEWKDGKINIRISRQCDFKNNIGVDVNNVSNFQHLALNFSSDKCYIYLDKKLYTTTENNFNVGTSDSYRPSIGNYFYRDSGNGNGNEQHNTSFVGAICDFKAIDHFLSDSEIENL